MTSIANPIEREAVASLHPSPEKPDTSGKYESLLRAVLEDQPVADPAVTAMPTQLRHVFHGSGTGTLLSVAFMDKAVPGHDMRLWVEAPQAMTGFPVLDLVSGDEKPQLLQWQYEGEFEVVAHRLGLDEAHCWSGLAQLDQGRPPLRRIYVAALRKATFAWLITLVVETAVLPGMLDEIVQSNDHVRAGATYGDVRLG